MPKITYVPADESARTTLDLPLGTSVMRGAVTNDVDGIVARCGGNLQCATCHVYVAPESTAELEPPRSDEDEMLDFTACPREPGSRLSCQLRVTEALDGLVVRLPERQI
ncbi:2Fe-2S iron-sulfur cluster-binding protein [Streptomyces sp. NPDC048172]|uniref:2Fe-2S iron-sulfur cluster-binding protein n=1 Tax=Streptomyces sp. NPDC048172 TaxID=3365505 RepID=UPI00370FE5F1